MVICFTHSFPNKVSNKGDFWVEHLTWKTGFFCVAGQQHVTERNKKDLSILHSWTLPKMLYAFSLLFSVCFWTTHHLYSCDFHLHLYSCWQLMLKACTENEFKEKYRARNYLTCNGFRVGHDYQMFLGCVCVLCVWNYWLIGWPNLKQCYTYGQTWRRKHKLQL
jgi:hypothetical protein